MYIYFLTVFHYKIFVRLGTRKTITLEVEPSDTIKTVKAKIRGKERIPPECHQLRFAGNLLNDWSALSYYNIREDATIDLSMTDWKGNQL